MPAQHRHTYHLALTGYPLGHSLSPAIHNAALRACQLDGEYILRPVSPDQIGEQLKNFAAELRSGQLDGMNITIPHKQAVVKICDQLTHSAQMIGAVNLLSLQNGQILGDNSDARGFMAALSHYSRPTRRALVLGAGGSARAVVYALASSGWEVCIHARRFEQASQLAAELAHTAKPLPPQAIQFPDNSVYLDSINLLVNTTPLGMYPNPEGSPWPAALPLPAQAMVYDLVYNPRETTLLRRAAAQGLPTIGGISMLVEQAAIAFECWTGRAAPREAMYASVNS